MLTQPARAGCDLLWPSPCADDNLLLPEEKAHPGEGPAEKDRDIGTQGCYFGASMSHGEKLLVKK